MSDSHFRDEPGHPSHGLIHAARVSSSGNRRFFGSAVGANHYINLRVTRGRAYFNRVSGTHHMDGEMLVEVRMTPTQWAELLTTLNAGVGVPCTLETVRTGDVEQVPDPPPAPSEAIKLRDAFVAEVGEKLAALGSMKRRILKQLDEAKLAKLRREEIGRELEAFFRLFESSAPFMMERFEEATEASVADAKANITAFADHALREAGLAALAEGRRPSVVLELQQGED